MDPLPSSSRSRSTYLVVKPDHESSEDVKSWIACRPSHSSIHGLRSVSRISISLSRDAKSAEPASKVVNWFGRFAAAEVGVSLAILPEVCIVGYGGCTGKRLFGW